MKHVGGMLLALALSGHRQLPFPFSVETARYRGLVLDRASGKPVVGAEVRGISFEDRVVASTRTDDAGSFEFEGRQQLPRVRLTAAGYGLAFGDLEADPQNPERPLVYRLDRAARLRGQVLGGNGAPLPTTRVRVWVSPEHLLQPEPMPDDLEPREPILVESWEATTDACGRFDFLELPARAWLRIELPSLPAWSDRCALAPGEERELTLGPGATRTTEPEPAGLFVRSLVVGDEPWNGGALVEVRPPDGREPFQVRLDSDGFIGPLPGGEYRLRVSRDGQFQGEALVARAGGPAVQLLLPPIAGRISVTESHSPHFVTVQFFVHGSGVDAGHGYFAPGTCVGGARNFEAGLYDAVATTSERRLGRLSGLRPTPEGTYANVELRPCATLRIVYTGPSTFARVRVHQDGLAYATRLATRDAACGLLVPPGKLKVELTPLRTTSGIPNGPTLEREVDIPVGEELELLLP